MLLCFNCFCLCETFCDLYVYEKCYKNKIVPIYFLRSSCSSFTISMSTQQCSSIMPFTTVLKKTGLRCSWYGRALFAMKILCVKFSTNVQPLLVSTAISWCTMNYIIAGEWFFSELIMAVFPLWLTRTRFFMNLSLQKASLMLLVKDRLKCFCCLPEFLWKHLPFLSHFPTTTFQMVLGNEPSGMKVYIHVRAQSA